MNGKLRQIKGWETLARQAKCNVVNFAKLHGISSRNLERHFLETYQKTSKAWLAELCRRAGVKSIM